MDPLQWMGAVRTRVQTADKNITIIHTTPVHQLQQGMEALLWIMDFYGWNIALKIFFFS